jgi:hypothetical protein
VVVVRSIRDVAIIAIIGAISGAVAGVLTQASVELSFKDPRKVKSYDEVINFAADLSEPTSFRGYYGEADEDSTFVSEARVMMRYSKLTRRVVGEWTKVSDERNSRIKEKIYLIRGFRNDEYMALADFQSATTGAGTYFLKRFAILPGPELIHAGYAIAQDVRSDSQIWVTQCPYVLIDESLAESRYSTIELAKKGIPFLTKPCSEYQFPRTVQ